MVKELKEIRIINSGEKINFKSGELLVDKSGKNWRWEVELVDVENIMLVGEIFEQGDAIGIELISSDNKRYQGNVIVENIKNYSVKLLGTGEII